MYLVLNYFVGKMPILIQLSCLMAPKFMNHSLSLCIFKQLICDKVTQLESYQELKYLKLCFQSDKCLWQDGGKNIHIFKFKNNLGL